MRDYDNPRPGSRAGIASALTSITLRERPTSISSFSDLSASSTNIYSTHARRVRSVRKLRQIFGPDDTVDTTAVAVEKELPPPPTTPLFSPFLAPPNDDSTITSSSPISDVASEDETRGEKSTSLVYARLVKLEKLKRQFGEEVPKELVFFDQPHHPSSPTQSHRGRSLSSPNVMSFEEKKEESFLGHIKTASVSTIPIPNVSQAALKRSRAKLVAWKSKAKKQPAEDIDNGDDGGWMRIIKGERSLDAEAADDTSCPDRLTSLQGSDWEYISKSDDKDLDVNHTPPFMQPQFNASSENSHVDLQGVQIVRSRSTLIIDRTSEDDEKMQVRSTVESSNKSMISIVMDSPVDSEQLLDSLYPLTLRRSHDETLGNDSPSQPISPAHAPRKVRSAVALTSKSRNSLATHHQTSLPASASTSYGRGPSSLAPPSHHRKETSWNDENTVLASEDDKRTGRSISRGSKPKGPRPSSRSRPRTADGSLTTTPTTIITSFREAVEHWQLLERQHKVQKSNKPPSPTTMSDSLPLPPNRNSLPPPPPPTKSPTISKNSSEKFDESNDSPLPSPPLITGPSMQKIATKTTATMIYFYHRGVVRLAVDDSTRGPKAVQTVHMRDVLNYLREMRYVH